MCTANVYAQDKDVPYSGLVKRFDYGVESHSYVTFYNGVDYSKVYDFNYYLNRYPDVQAAYGKDDIAVLSHFVNIGMNEGRQACKTFDVQSYYNANPI